MSPGKTRRPPSAAQPNPGGARQGPQLEPAPWPELSAALAGFLEDDTCLGLTVVASSTDQAFSLSRTGPNGELEISFVLSGTQLEQDLPRLQRWFELRALRCTEDLRTDDLLGGDLATRHVAWSVPRHTPEMLFEVCYRLMTEALGVRSGSELECNFITAVDVIRGDRPM